MVAHPIALLPTGKEIEIADAERGIEYRAICCGGRMFPRRREAVLHHFYHFKPGDCVGPETARHRIAKYKIVKGWLNARERGSAYYACVICRRCKTNVIEIDLVDFADNILVEKQTLPPFIPDVSFTRSGQLVLGIEVIVTSESRLPKVWEYRKQHVPVLEVRPSDISVWQLDQRIDASGSDVLLCDLCQPAKDRFLAEVQRNLKSAAVEAELKSEKPAVLAEIEPSPVITEYDDSVARQLSLELANPKLPDKHTDAPGKKEPTPAYDFSALLNSLIQIRMAATVVSSVSSLLGGLAKSKPPPKRRRRRRR